MSRSLTPRRSAADRDTDEATAAVGEQISSSKADHRSGNGLEDPGHDSSGVRRQDTALYCTSPEDDHVMGQNTGDGSRRGRGECPGAFPVLSGSIGFRVRVISANCYRSSIRQLHSTTEVVCSAACATDLVSRVRSWSRPERLLRVDVDGLYLSCFELCMHICFDLSVVMSTQDHA